MLRKCLLSIVCGSSSTPGSFHCPAVIKKKSQLASQDSIVSAVSLGLENAGEHKDRSRLFRSRAAHKEDSSQNNLSAKWLVLTCFLCFIWAQRVFTAGQMTRVCWLRSHKVGTESGMEGPDTVLRPLRVLSVGSASALRCTVGALLIMKRTELIW